MPSNKYSQWDEFGAYASSDDEYEYFEARDKPKERWIEENYEALQELYTIFKEAGKKLFGSGFHQYGNFGEFITLTYTGLSSSNEPRS